jgi:hypothetical protein
LSLEEASLEDRLARLAREIHVRRNGLNSEETERNLITGMSLALTFMLGEPYDWAKANEYIASRPWEQKEEES